MCVCASTKPGSTDLPRRVDVSIPGLQILGERLILPCHPSDEAAFRVHGDGDVEVEFLLHQVQVQGRVPGMVLCTSIPPVSVLFAFAIPQNF